MAPPPDDRSDLTPVLDRVESVATVIYVAMIAVLAIVVLGVLTYLVLKPPASWGSQGEWFYLLIGFLLVISWIVGQLTWVLRRRRRRQLRGAASGKPTIQIKPSRWSLRWGSLPALDSQTAKENALNWSGESGPIPTTTFRLNASQLATARDAQEQGKSWEEIARQINQDYGSLSAFEQSLYQRALEMALSSEQ